jgi:hypothetical protein
MIDVDQGHLRVIHQPSNRAVHRPRSGVDKVMSTLKFNFNKPKPVIKQATTSSKPAFDDSEDEDSITNPEKPKKRSMAISGLNEDLRSYTSLSEDTSARMAKEALQVDPSGPSQSINN